MNRWLSAVFFLVLAVFAGGALAGEGEAQGSVQHVVIAWLTDPTDKALRARYLEISRSLAKLPGVISYHAGTPIPGRAPVDDSYDVAVVAVLKDQKALEEYKANPLHQQAVDAMRPLVQKVVVYDFAE